MAKTTAQVTQIVRDAIAASLGVTGQARKIRKIEQDISGGNHFTVTLQTGETKTVTIS